MKNVASFQLVSQLMQFVFSESLFVLYSLLFVRSLIYEFFKLFGIRAKLSPTRPSPKSSQESLDNVVGLQGGEGIHEWRQFRLRLSILEFGNDVRMALVCRPPLRPTNPQTPLFTTRFPIPLSLALYPSCPTTLLQNT